MDVNGSTAGCAAGAGLALASRYFHDLKYLEIAEVAVQMYYIQDFLRGYAGGGASEILQSPDSEAPWDMLESCMALYEVTGNREWVNKAKFATDMLSTWMVSYDYAFPRGSAMQRAGTHAAGSIFASSQNNHSAPGFYILSGDCLLKLFRATGDRRYAEMYRDTAHNVIQYVGAPHNPLRHESGYVTERVQLSDWEGNNVGSVSYGDSNMAWETLAALTCLENPGIYLHTDDDTFSGPGSHRGESHQAGRHGRQAYSHQPHPVPSPCRDFRGVSGAGKEAAWLECIPCVAESRGQSWRDNPSLHQAQRIGGSVVTANAR